MDKDKIKESLARLLGSKQITQTEYDNALSKLDNYQTTTEQEVVDNIIKEVAQ